MPPFPNQLATFICFTGWRGSKGDIGEHGPLGAKGAKGEPGPGSLTFEPDRPVPTSGLICVDVEILFHNAPAEGCTLSPDAVKKSIASQIGEREENFENIRLFTKVQDGKRQLQVKFRTTENAERIIKADKGRIKLPLDKAKCNYTNVLLKGTAR